MLVGLTGTISLADDILVWGTDRASHDRKLYATLTVLQERGATLNVDKCLIAVTDLVFFGLRITDKGIGISNEKLKALLEAPPPKSPGETLSYIGLATFCERFIRNLATIVDPLRQLTRPKVPWTWGEKQQQAFEALERESLAIVWACEKFCIYLIGCEFDLYTDNSAAQAIFSNPHSNPSARIRRLTLRMLPLQVSCVLHQRRWQHRRLPVKKTYREHLLRT